MDSLLSQLYEQLEIQRRRIEQCLGRLSEDDLWKRPREGVSSIGNLCLHLAGNESHYIGRGIGKSDYARDRPGEFETSGGHTRSELIERLREARSATRDILERLSPEDFQRPVDVDYPPSPTVIGVILHVVEHYAYHTGQIVLQTRILQEENRRILEWGH